MFEPLNALSRITNSKRHFPPLHLRVHVGPFRNYETATSEFRMYLKMLCGIKSFDSLLDIGCGHDVIYSFLKSYYRIDCNYFG